MTTNVAVPGINPKQLVHGEQLSHWAPFVVASGLMAIGYRPDQFCMTGEPVRLGRWTTRNCLVVCMSPHAGDLLKNREMVFSVECADISKKNLERLHAKWRALPQEAVQEIATTLMPVVGPVLKRIDEITIRSPASSAPVLDTEPTA